MSDAVTETKEDKKPIISIDETKSKKGKSGAATKLLNSMATPAAEEEKKEKEKKKKPEIQEETILHTVTFDLTEEEFATKGKEAAALQSEINKLNLDFDVVKRTHKAETSLREEKVGGILSTIRRGKEDREVECKKVYDYDSGLIRFFFKNTMVEERPMNQAEKQMKAFF